MPGALYPRLLGPAWQDLHPAVRRAHCDAGPVAGAGRCRVGRGAASAARLVAWLLSLPGAADDLEVRLAVTPAACGETWERTFGGHRFVTRQYECRGGLLAERFGFLELRFRLSVAEGGILYRQEGASLRLGRLGCSLPAWSAPRVTAWERPAPPPEEGTLFDVRVSLPWAGDLFSYAGRIGC